MDWLTFLAAVVGHIAWPTAALAAFFLLKREVLQALGRLEKLKHGNTEIVFRSELDEAANIVSADQTEISTTNKKSDPLDFFDAADRIAAVNPSAGILICFKEIENKILSLGKKYNFSLTHFNRDHQLKGVMRQLISNKMISREYFEVFERLQKARNAAAHAFDRELTYEDFLEFKIISKKLFTELENSNKDGDQ
ncbi:MAG: hypothetical protein INF16_02445 [Methylobacterium sp.]|nr:hypothetical protein [Methylobacterium sp.]